MKITITMDLDICFKYKKCMKYMYIAKSTHNKLCVFIAFNCVYVDSTVYVR